MRARLLIVAAILGASVMLLPTAASAQTVPPTCSPYVTLTPPFGTPGTEVSVNLFQFPPNDEIEVIARVAGNPVVGTGTTDADGRANIIITIPDFSERVAIFVQASPCYAAGAYFEYREVTPTPTRTPIPATATPTSTPALPTVTPPPPTPTPQPPIAGTGSSGSALGTGMNLAIVGLALAIFCGAFALWGSTRSLQAQRIRRRDE